MKTNILIAAVAILFVMASCKKENILPDANGELLTKVILTELVTNKSGTGNYFYNELGQLTSIVGNNNDINSPDTTWSLFTYNAAGHLSSLLVTNNTTGHQYKYNYTSDAAGKILTCTGEAMQPNMYLHDVKFVYNRNGRITSDTSFTKTGEMDGYSVLEYDNNSNISAYQDFVITGATVYSQGKFTYQYDNKRSPFNKIGKLLYQIAPNSNSYFYLNKNNTVLVFLNGVPFTPGGNFVNQYYSNDLLRFQRLNVNNSLVQEFFYK